MRTRLRLDPARVDFSRRDRLALFFFFFFFCALRGRLASHSLLMEHERIGFGRHRGGGLLWTLFLLNGFGTFPGKALDGALRCLAFPPIFSDGMALAFFFLFVRVTFL